MFDVATRKVLSCLPPDLHHELRRQVGSKVSVVCVTALDLVEKELEAAYCVCMVMDPLTIPVEQHDRLLALSVRFSRPAILWIPLTTAAIPVTMGASAKRHTELVFRGSRDDTGLLRRRILALPRQSAASLTIWRLRENLERMPQLGALTAVGLLAGEWRLHSVDHLAQVAGADRRTVTRWFSAAGLRGGKLLVDATRVLAAWERLHDGYENLDGLAREVGFGCTRSLRRATERTTGWAIGQLRQAGSAEAVADRVAFGVQTGGH